MGRRGKRLVTGMLAELGDTGKQVKRGRPKTGKGAGPAGPGPEAGGPKADKRGRIVVAARLDQALWEEFRRRVFARKADGERIEVAEALAEALRQYLAGRPAPRGGRAGR